MCALPQLLEASVFYGRLFYRVTHHTEPVQIITTQGKLETHKFPHDSLPIMPLSFGYLAAKTQSPHKLVHCGDY